MSAKLVPVLRLSTPLRLRRAACKPIMPEHPVYVRAVANYTTIKGGTGERIRISNFITLNDVPLPIGPHQLVAPAGFEPTLLGSEPSTLPIM